jgi:hypothetical protein
MIKAIKSWWKGRKLIKKYETLSLKDQERILEELKKRQKK